MFINVRHPQADAGTLPGGSRNVISVGVVYRKGSGIYLVVASAERRPNGIIIASIFNASSRLLQATKRLSQKKVEAWAGMSWNVVEDMCNHLGVVVED